MKSAGDSPTEGEAIGQKPATPANGLCLTLVLVLFFLSAPLGLSAADQSVVINEIVYHPPGGQTNLQFVELFNFGGTELELSNWAFTKGIKFTFPPGTKMAPGSYLVVCRNPKAFAQQYGQGIRALGPFTGKLSYKSERLELSNTQGHAVDSLRVLRFRGVAPGCRWVFQLAGTICPVAESDAPGSWAASACPSSKRAAGSPGRQNDSYSANLPPVISQVEFSPKAPSPRQRVKITARVSDSDGVGAVNLLYRIASPGRQSEEKMVMMARNAGDAKSGLYEGTIDAQPQGQLVRFQIRAVDALGTERFEPAVNEPRPTYSYFSFTNAAPASIPLGFLVNVERMSRGPGHYQVTSRRRSTAATSGVRGGGAFLYVPAGGAEAETYDYVQIVARSGGYKVHFQKDRSLKGMTGINVISEGPMRWVLAEPLSYVVYRMAGVPAPLTEHIRLSIDGRVVGFHLLIEQPNKSFLARNGRDESGNLYKLIWYGQGVIGQHEKKTNPSTGHADLLQLLDALKRKSGAEQWAFIQQNFNVQECVNYYAVSMCIQNWDGFFNNHFVYHDLAGSGKWEIYPWDEDKTWGDYDGASPRYDWYAMPLTFGMNGDGSGRDSRQFGGITFGGANWWRPPGYFSGPLLANPEFRKEFRIRLREICLTIFTEENFGPIIDTMEKRLAPEVRLRAQATGQNPERALREFTGYMQSFRNQVQNRRKFILAELAK